MFNINLLFEFSRNHCVAICALMVPASLLLTLRTMMYRSLGTPIEAVAEGVQAMKSIAIPLLSGEDTNEVSYYFDYLIGALQ